MSFFNKVFSSNNKEEQSSKGKGDFILGRYTEVNKKLPQSKYWQMAQDDFNSKNYLSSFNNLLLYMLDPEVNNLKINKTDGKIEFECQQGSKIIRGNANNDKFAAEARIASFDKLSVSFMRKLMNMNYVHQYTRFAIKDDVIYLKFDSKTVDASPNKIYYSLRELCLKSDKADDSLTTEFENLHPIDINHVVHPPDNIKEIKYKYLQKWIGETIESIDKLNAQTLSGGISYMLLALIFRIDCLLQPQGAFFEDIEKINNIYNAKDNKPTHEKNRLMIEELTRLKNKSREEIFKDIYDVKLTFGFVPSTSHKQFYEFILEQFKNTGWYYDNRYDNIATYIYEWIIGYSIFYFGLFPASYDFLKICYAALQPDFYREMGYSIAVSQNQNIDKSVVEKEIQKIIKKHITDYPKIGFVTQNINYSNLNNFLYSMLNEITYLNFNK